MRVHPDLFVLKHRRALWSGLAAAAFIVVALLLRQPYLFNLPMVAWGDDAMYAIEIDDAKELRLLDGAASRIGTSHPGPALFYIAGAFDAVVHGWLHAVPEPLNAQRIGYGMLAAALLGAAVALFARRATVLETIVAAAVLTAMMSVTPFVFASSWLPYVYCLPYLLHVVAAGALLSGDRRAMLPYTIASWLLIHGHVGFIQNVGAMTGFIVVVLLWRHRHEVTDVVRRNARALVPSAVASAVFLLPLVINLFVNWPSPWLDYYEIAQKAERDPRTVREVLSFVTYYLTWKAQVPLWVPALLAAASIGAVMSLPRTETRRLLVWLLTTAAVGLVSFLVYATIGVDRLSEKYLGLYAFGLPAVIVAAGAVALCRRFVRLAPFAAAGAVVLVLVVAAKSEAFISYDRGSPEVSAIATSLKGNAGRQGRPIALTFDNGAWPFAVAVMQYGAHNGLPACVEEPFWTWFVTKRFICRPDQIAASWRVFMTPVNGPPAKGAMLITTQSVVVATAESN